MLLLRNYKIKMEHSKKKAAPIHMHIHKQNKMLELMIKLNHKKIKKVLMIKISRKYKEIKKRKIIKKMI